ncbi:MAG: alanine--tRNA ligase [Nanoarchaeota archaeon]|nr:alanine--tRNA ligase [Nanoarchaeota archaeon]
MDRKELIKKYIDFFKSKNHKEIKNSSLVPENDPTVLFTTAGMHPLVPFLSGVSHPEGKRLVNVQRCIRTGDIEEVGDTTHHTMFEMLGNWSLGDYFKKEAIEYSFEFLTSVLNISKERLAITVFGGDENAPVDEEAVEIWKSLGIPVERIELLGKEDNWWGPAGNTGPCGPDTEMFYWKLNNKEAPKEFDPNNENWVEIWNDVLMQYDKDEKGNYNEAKQKNIDTGMGVERTVAILNGLEDNYIASMWKPIIEKIEKISNKKYSKNEDIKKSMRIIADHLKASVFMIHDGVVPGNSEQGYVLRRLIRRSIRFGKTIGIEENFTTKIADEVYKIYDDYNLNSNKISTELAKEEENFSKTLEQGLKSFEKLSIDKKKISGKDAFLLYQSYGFPIEMTRELANEKGIEINEGEFEKEEASHQELSRTASAGKFKSGLADSSIETTKLHTATHMLNQALSEVLGKEVSQKGSNITPERLRFDFNFDRKMTTEEIKAVEDLVNKKIKENLEMTIEEMSIEDAKASGAKGVFDSKYEELVKVYTLGNYSKEICGGPHIKNTSELGRFKITKEESSSAGIRRIKAVLE